MEWAVNEGLQASTHSELADVLLEIEGQYAQHPEPETDVDTAYEIVTRQRQVVFGCLEELIALRGVNAINEHLDKGRKFIEPPSENSPAFTPYDAATNAEKATQATYEWLKTALDEVRNDALRGKMPDAAILDVGQDVHAAYRWTRQSWMTYSTQRWAKRWNQTKAEVIGDDVVRYIDKGVLQPNVLFAIGLLVDSAASHGRLKLPQQLEEITWLASAPRSVGAPISAHARVLLSAYAAWDTGELTSDEFHDKVRSLSLSTYGSYHKSLANGPLEHIGHCSAALPFTQPKLIEGTARLLKRVGVDAPPEFVTMTHVALASGFLACMESILTHWPD
jgi:hypothetical protein